MIYKILIIEDNLKLAQNISEILMKYKYEVKIAENFENIDLEVEEETPDLILLDVNLPYFNGFYWCNKIRKITKSPIIIISSRNSKMDQIAGIEYGADDYIIKPFDSEILIAKINGLIRRVYGEFSNNREYIEVNSVKLHSDTFILEHLNNKVELSILEFKTLLALMKNYPNLVTRDDLMIAIWDSDNFIEENTLNVNIKRVRELLTLYKIPLEIKTIRSVGYKLVVGE